MSSRNSEEYNRKARLLCVDDDLRFLGLFTAVLEVAGYSVVAVGDPQKALALATSAAFDLVILDYDMPNMNGAELACRIKQHKSDLPVILFSGNSCLPAAACDNVDEHLVKGESVESLLQALRARIRPLTHWPDGVRKSSARIVNRSWRSPIRTVPANTIVQ
jgi:CheY-like chemotaxis protein